MSHPGLNHPSAPAHGPGIAAIRHFTAVLLLVMLGITAGCGFQMRGSSSLPFETLYIPGSSTMGVELKRNIAAGTGTRPVNTPEEAQAQIGEEVPTPTVRSLQYELEGQAVAHLPIKQRSTLRFAAQGGWQRRPRPVPRGRRDRQRSARRLVDAGVGSNAQGSAVRGNHARYRARRVLAGIRLAGQVQTGGKRRAM